MTSIHCPICGSPVASGEANGGTKFDCSVCGRFSLSTESLEDKLLDKLTPHQRAFLSHRVRVASGTNSLPIAVHASQLEDCSDYILPLASEQARNVIRLVGEHERVDGRALDPPPHFHASVGAFSREAAMRLVGNLVKNGILRARDASSKEGPDFLNLTLTLEGWREYESIAAGRQPSKHGFIALPFGEPSLDQFVTDHVRPATEALGYPLEDMRIAARAGVIDDLMRQHIRDAAFVLADLTHQNRGAYWEAGYAEGLGKPTIYLCRHDLFSPQHVHFDTNHCTTVIWNPDEGEDFRKRLTAVLRRSLGLFQ